ncbi:MAG: shikimate kinase [Thermoprotei archaeon]
MGKIQKLWESIAYGGISVVNAIPFGLGSTMAVRLQAKVRAEIELGPGTIGIGHGLLDALRIYFRALGFPVTFYAFSDVPQRQGLKSSSAISVAAIKSALRLLGAEGIEGDEGEKGSDGVDESDPPELSDISREEMKKNPPPFQRRLLKIFGVNENNYREAFPPYLSAILSKASGLSVTGALDDATAAYWGGVSFTDNTRMRIIKVVQPPKEVSVIIGVGGKRRVIDRVRLMSFADNFKRAFALAYSGDLYRAMNISGRTVAEAMGYDPEPILGAYQRGALASGITGNGPAYFAIVAEGDEGPVLESWSKKVRGIIVTRPMEIESRN